MAKKKKKNGRPKGSKGPLKRYLEYLFSAKKIESKLKIYKNVNGVLEVDNREYKIESKIDIGHEIIFTLIYHALVKEDMAAMRMLLNRRYGRIADLSDEDKAEMKGQLLEAMFKIVEES